MSALPIQLHESTTAHTTTIETATVHTYQTHTDNNSYRRQFMPTTFHIEDSSYRLQLMPIPTDTATVVHTVFRMKIIANFYFIHIRFTILIHIRPVIWPRFIQTLSKCCANTPKGTHSSVNLIRVRQVCNRALVNQKLAISIHLSSMCDGLLQDTIHRYWCMNGACHSLQKDSCLLAHVTLYSVQKCPRGRVTGDTGMDFGDHDAIPTPFWLFLIHLQQLQPIPRCFHDSMWNNGVHDLDLVGVCLLRKCAQKWQELLHTIVRWHVLRKQIKRFRYVFSRTYGKAVRQRILVRNTSSCSYSVLMRSSPAFLLTDWHR